MYVVYATFVKPSSLGGCMNLAQQSLAAQNLIIVRQADGAEPLVIGGDDAVTITIVGVPRPNGTWMVVSASSGDPNVAARARDVTRGMIESTPVP